MGKTRAEYQREYRERKKKNDSTYLQKERERAKSNRVPIESLSKHKKEKVRERNRNYASRFRAKRKEQLAQNDDLHMQPDQSANTDLPEQSDKVSSSSSRSIGTRQYEIKPSSSGSGAEQKDHMPLRVRLPFCDPNKRRPARRSKALRSATYKISQLESKLKSLKKENEKLKKRNQRLSNKPKLMKQRNIETRANESMTSTPRSKTKSELKAAGLNPDIVPQNIKKKLVMVNAMIEEVKSAKKLNIKEKSRKILVNIVSGKIVKKYRCVKTLSCETGLSRRSINQANSKDLAMKPRLRQIKEKAQLKRKVTEFMERDDVSVNLPGKRDCKKVKTNGESEKKVKKQTRVLSDYLSNVFEKFKSENPKEQISKSVFCRLRPSHILLTKLISRNTCLCSKHQNMAMKLKALKEIGVPITRHPETASKSVTNLEMSKLLEKGLEANDNIEFEEWRRVEVDGKKRMKVIKITMAHDEFETYMKMQYSEFLEHVQRVKAQYNSIRQLKENLPEHELVVHLDFAENFTCCNADEIQSAYWNSTAVTLHPVVVYFKNVNDLQHKSYIYVSGVASHNSTAVYTILKKLVPDLKALIPNLKMIHYWTDSPSSQYRNRFIFDIVINHMSLFGVAARWNYFECGHGKGPCDGIGGISKRQAGEASKQGKVIIQDAQDYYRWAIDSSKSIEYVLYSADEYETASEELKERNPKVIPGTMKLHAVFPKEEYLYTGIVSCYCNKCIDGELCGQWEKHPVGEHTMVSTYRNKKRKRNESDTIKEDQQQKKVALEKIQKNDALNSKTVDKMPEEGNYVLVKYDETIYPAKVLEVDTDAKDARVSFMMECKGKSDVPLFKWPTKPDELWVEHKQFVSIIDEPSPCGKTKRQFRLHTSDYSFLKH